jgi:hypothetical protein
VFYRRTVADEKKKMCGFRLYNSPRACRLR